MARDSAARVYAPNPVVAKNPELKVLRRRAFAGAFTPRIFFSFVLVMMLFSLMVYNHVHLNELTSEVSALNNQLAILESESVRYASLLETTVSLRAIAQQAEEMGMVRLDQYRTVHVYLFEDDQIILFGQADGQDYAPGGMLATLGSIINSARAYISGI